MHAKRRGIRWFLLGVIALAIIAIILVVILIINVLSPSPKAPDTSGPSSTTSPSKPSVKPSAQPAGCPDVQVVVVPGTWESSSNDDPYKPHANPRSLMLKVSTPLADAFPSSRADVYTVPYVAKFRNPLNLGDHTATYNDSRAEGTRRARDEISRVGDHCPLTGFVLMGFSQGAVITGDIASDIGNGRGPIAEDQVLGVGLIADGRRKSGEAKSVGPRPPGVGAELALSGFGGIVPGITMTGDRSGGFGSLRDRTYSLCAPGDLVCDSPTIANPLEAIGKLAGAINNPVHASYATTRYWNLRGESAASWMTGWSRGLITDAPHPAHK